MLSPTSSISKVAITKLDRTKVHASVRTQTISSPGFQERLHPPRERRASSLPSRKVDPAQRMLILMISLNTRTLAELGFPTDSYRAGGDENHEQRYGSSTGLLLGQRRRHPRSFPSRESPISSTAGGAEAQLEVTRRRLCVSTANDDWNLVASTRRRGSHMHGLQPSLRLR